MSKPKLRTYRHFKTKLKMEQYLAHGSSASRRILFSVRSGSNRLRIDSGRARGESEEERVCELCQSSEIESELHFATSCDRYSDLRVKFFDQVLQATDEVNLHRELDKDLLLKIILCATEGRGEVWSEVCRAAMNFVYLAMKRRAVMLGERMIS